MLDWNLFTTVVLQAFTLAFMLVGLFGLIIPIFPGIAVIWLSALVFAIIQGVRGSMTVVDWVLFGFITILMVIGSVVDNIIIMRKLRETGTPWRSITIGYAAGIVSSLFLTPFAALLITPLAMYGAEYYRLRKARQAFDSAKSWLIGFSWSFLALFAIGSVMIGLWLLWALV